MIHALREMGDLQVSYLQTAKVYSTPPTDYLGPQNTDITYTDRKPITLALRIYVINELSTYKIELLIPSSQRGSLVHYLGASESVSQHRFT